jgi:hypothetical protein
MRVEGSRWVPQSPTSYDPSPSSRQENPQPPIPSPRTLPKQVHHDSAQVHDKQDGGEDAEHGDEPVLLYPGDDGEADAEEDKVFGAVEGLGGDVNVGGICGDGLVCVGYSGVGCEGKDGR